MEAKVFVCTPHELEKELKEWVKKVVGLEIISMVQSESGGCGYGRRVTLTILYNGTEL